MADDLEPKFVDVRNAGRKGGNARAKSLTPGERAAIAKKAATTRWAKEKAKKPKKTK
jgi:hypothetical protein